MTLELLLLCSLIFIFLVSFCGLLQKIKQSYERERLIAVRRFAVERTADRHIRNGSNLDGYMNSTFTEDLESGIFPGAPPPYSHFDEPPNYEDIVKSEDEVINRILPSVPADLTRVNSAPPPYTPYTITT